MPQMQRGLSGAKQFWVMIASCFIASSVFMIAYYQTEAADASMIYFGFVFGWGLLLIVFLIYYSLRGSLPPPLSFACNLDLWKYMIAIILVPIFYGLTLLVDNFTGAQMKLTTFIPEVLSLFTAIPVLDLFDVNSLIGVIQVGFWNVDVVGPAEEMFKLGAVLLLLLAIRAYLKPRGKFTKTTYLGIGLLVTTGINVLWTGMHGFYAYHSLSEFLVAFGAGEMLILSTWFLGNPFPAVIAHGLWNTMAALSWLNPFSAIVMFVIGVVLMVGLYLYKKM